MRKKIIYLIVAMMLVSVMAVPAMAADAPTASGIYDLKAASGYTNLIQFDAVKTASGETVTGAQALIGGTTVNDFYANGEKIDMTFKGAQKDGYYFLVATNGGTVPTEANIVYLNQETASGSDVAFSLYPSKLEEGKTYSIQMSTNKNSDGLVTVASFKYYEYVPYTLGDVDGDKSVSPVDALWVLQAVARNKTFTETQVLAGDVDHSKDITPIDALWILQAVARIRVLE